MTLRILLVALGGLVLHLLFGWVWGFPAALIGGFLVTRKGWLIGGAGLGLAWAVLLAWDIARAPSQVAEMARVTASLLGDLPSISTYLVTILIGLIIGIFAGATGSSLKSLLVSESNG